ncbi:MAG: hypothetical protein JWO48_1205 [Bryobacterales bacterium]|nr:hypothetical protein [Bryobacterales bacterium]
MLTAVYIAIALIAGVAIGATLHSWFAKKTAATKEEIYEWSARIRSAMTSEEKAAKEKLRSLVTEIEKKL